MMARRSSALIADQRPISSIERRQPVQRRLSGCTTQMLMQGLSTSSRCQTLFLVTAHHLQTVQKPLKDIARRHMVDDLGAAFAGGIGLKKRAFGGHGRQALVPIGDRQRAEPVEVAREGAGRLAARPLGAIHIPRQPQNQPADAAFGDDLGQPGGIDAELLRRTVSSGVATD